MTGGLAGRSILITRPAGQAERVAARVRAAGGEAIVYPAIEIAPPENPHALGSILDRLDGFQIAIFISPTAVAKGHAAVVARRAWPIGMRLAAVGEGTAAALAALGFEGVIAPVGRGDSEALAAMAELSDVRGKSIVIFRGEGGRESLRRALEARGASVEYAECYRRVRPRADPAALIARWAHSGVHAVSITSTEGLENLIAILGEQGAAHLRATPVFVPHPRVAEAARLSGVRETVLVDPGDDALVQALASFFATVRSAPEH
ncbi:MAG: uroporphyrinogen-III synthase [Betaproteobacteria bacterium]|nr:uroporphyrinogen-III synthase [Betaproteobacteria bacterium]